MDEKKEKENLYTENAMIIKNLSNRIEHTVKGRYWSFKDSIVDDKGAFVHKKLVALIDEMLKLWEERLRRDYADAKSYIEEHEPLYRNYLYIAMRCSLIQGVYRLGENVEPESPDFAYILDRTKELELLWCVLQYGEDVTENVPFWGFPETYGYHCYPLMSRVLKQEDMRYLNAPKDFPQKNIERITETGNIKGSEFRRLPGYRDLTGEASDAPYDIPEETELSEEFIRELADQYEDYDAQTKAVIQEIEAEWAQKETLLDDIAWGFDYRKEYMEACENFEDLYRRGKVDKIYKDIEAIIDNYLIHTNKTMLLDTNKTLKMYKKLYEGYVFVKRHAEDSL